MMHGPINITFTYAGVKEELHAILTSVQRVIPCQIKILVSDGRRLFGTAVSKFVVWKLVSW